MRRADKQTEGDDANVTSTFQQLLEPKEEFLKIMLRPARTVCWCFKDEKFLDEFLKVKAKYGKVISSSD